MTLIWENTYFELGTERIFVNTTLLALDNSFWTICFGEIRSVHTTPEKFQNGRFTVKTHQMFSVHTKLEEFEKRRFHSENASNIFRPHYHFENRGSHWKRIKCFPSTLHRRNLKTEVSLWKRIQCFPSTLHRRNWKTEVSLWKRMKCFPSTLCRRN